MNLVQPIRDAAKLKWIREDLGRATDKHGERMFLLFELGINTGLRISDLVNLRVENVQGESITTREQKTGKETMLPLNANIRGIIQDRTRGKQPDALLFPSQKKTGDGKEKPITTRTAWNDMRIIAKRYGLGSRIGCHTLRKTFGYWHYRENKNLELLRQWFNHANPNVTLRYIGMDYEEKKKSVEGFNPGGAVYQPRGSVTRGKPAKASVPVEVTRKDRSKQGKILAEKAEKAREARNKKNHSGG